MSSPIDVDNAGACNTQTLLSSVPLGDDNDSDSATDDDASAHAGDKLQAITGNHSEVEGQVGINAYAGEDIQSDVVMRTEDGDSSDSDTSMTEDPGEFDAEIRELAKESHHELPKSSTSLLVLSVPTKTWKKHQKATIRIQKSKTES